MGIKISATLIALTDIPLFLAFNRFFGCRSPLPPHQPPPGALMDPENWFRNTGIREIYFPHLSNLRYFFNPVLVPILKSLVALPLATAFIFSTLHFSMSEEEYSSLVTTSASSAQVVIEGYKYVLFVTDCTNETMSCCLTTFKKDHSQHLQTLHQLMQKSNKQSSLIR